MGVLKLIVALVVMTTVIQAKEKQIIDLTHQLKTDMPIHPNYPKYNISDLRRGKYEETGWIEYFWLGMAEHTGTHMDAPAHFSREGKEMHEVPVDRFIGPGVVIRVTEKARENPDYQLTVDDILEWEKKHGQIPDNAIVMVDSGWAQKFSNAESFFGSQDVRDLSSFHFPSISSEVADFIAQYRQQISMLGVDSVSVDAPAAEHYVHLKLQPLGYLLLENLANLDQVPESGALIYCLPLNIYGGSGSPIRALAVIGDDQGNQAAGTPIVKVSYIICLLVVLAVNMLQ